MEAVDTGSSEIVKLLIEMGADLQIENNKSETALDYALRTRQKNIAEILAANLNASSF